MILVSIGTDKKEAGSGSVPVGRVVTGVITGDDDDTRLAGTTQTARTRGSPHVPSHPGGRAPRRCATVVIAAAAVADDAARATSRQRPLLPVSRAGSSIAVTRHSEPLRVYRADCTSGTVPSSGVRREHRGRANPQRGSVLSSAPETDSNLLLDNGWI